MEAEASSKSPQTSKLKIAGSWAGVLEADLHVWTLPMLREEVAKRSNCTPDCINLMCGGKILKDGDENAKLAQLGLKNNSKILASRVSADQGKALKNQLLAEEERSRRLARIKVIANALSKMHADGSLTVEDFNLDLEDQSGQKVQLGSENDQRAVVDALSKRNADGSLAVEDFNVELEDQSGQKVRLGSENDQRAATDALSKRHADGSLPVEDFNIELEDQSGQKVQLGSENDQRAAADALSKKHADGSLPVEDFNIELEDQSGQKVRLGSENDQRGVMMGLMFHANAKQLIKKPKDALDVLAMGEHASQEEVKRLEVEKAALARDLSAALLSGQEMQTLLDRAREARAKAEAEVEEAAQAAYRAAAPSSPIATTSQSGSEAAQEIARLTSENKALKSQLLDMMSERFKESQVHAEQLEKLRQEHMAALENERARRYRLRDQIREQGVGLSSTWVPARSRQALAGSGASIAYHPPLDQSGPS